MTNYKITLNIDSGNARPRVAIAIVVIVAMAHLLALHSAYSSTSSFRKQRLISVQIRLGL